MQDAILIILGVPIFVAELPSGDIKVWHPFNDRVRALVEPVCRGRGRWHPRFRNWIVFAPFKEAALAELRALAEVPHD